MNISLAKTQALPGVQAYRMFKIGKIARSLPRTSVAV